MKAKTLLAAAAAAMSVSAFADLSVAATNVLCRIALTTSEKEVLIGLPLVDVGGTTQTINATNYVSTTGLSTDDMLLGKVNGEWKAWSVQGGKWTAASVTIDNKTFCASDRDSFDRGGAVRFVKSSDPDGSYTIYLYGQVADAGLNGANPESTASRSSSGITYTLMSNLNPASKTLEAMNFDGLASGDKIALLSSNGTGQKEYFYNGTAWMQKTYTTVTNSTWLVETTYLQETDTDASSVAIAAGQGFWFIATKGTESVTANW